MDTLPPAPPPAIVQSESQQAIDAFQRIADTEAWLLDQRTAMPALLDQPDHTDKHIVLGALDTFWQAPMPGLAPGTTIPRRDLLARKLAAAMTDLASLRHMDGTLEARARTLVSAATTFPANMRPAEIEFRQVVFGHAAYAGAMILRDMRSPDLVLLFTTQRGWDVFANVDAAVASIDESVRHDLAMGQETAGLAPGEFDATLLPTASSRGFTGRHYEILADRLIDVQRIKVDDAWTSLQMSSHDETEQVTRRLHRILDPTYFLDAQTIIRLRDTHLFKAAAAARLEKLHDKPYRELASGAWRRAYDDYANALRSGTLRRVAAGIESLPDLQDYTLGILRDMLEAMGVTDAPEDIRLTLDRSGDAIARTDSLPSLIEGPEPVETTLLDLAYGNVPATGLGRFSARGAEGTIEALDDTVIRAMVRSLDVRTYYPELVESRLSTHGVQRQVAIDQQAARMRLEAADAFVAYLIGENPEQPHLSLASREWFWVQAVLDAPTPEGRRDVHGARIAAREVTYDGAVLRDVLEIAPDHVMPYALSNLSLGLVYYTPDAPDGVAFRRFVNRDDADRLFFHNPAFTDYLLDRLPAAFAHIPPNGWVRQFKVNDRTAWVLGKNWPMGYVRTNASFVSRDITGNVFESSYDAKVALLLRDARDQTRSAVEADISWAIDTMNSLRPAHRIASALAGALASPLRAAPSAWRAYEAARAGDFGRSFVDITEGYVAALGVLPVVAAPSAASHAWFRSRAGALMPQKISTISKPVARSPALSPRGRYSIDGIPCALVDDLLCYVGAVGFNPRSQRMEFTAYTDRPVSPHGERAVRDFQRELAHSQRTFPPTGVRRTMSASAAQPATRHGSGTRSASEPPETQATGATTD